MKRCLRSLVAAAAVSSLIVIGAPPAGAQNLGPCTIAYAEDVARTSSGPLITIVPPANITINGNEVLGIGDHLMGATRDYVRCLMWRG